MLEGRGKTRMRKTLRCAAWSESFKYVEVSIYPYETHQSDQDAPTLVGGQRTNCKDPIYLHTSLLPLSLPLLSVSSSDSCLATLPLQPDKALEIPKSFAHVGTMWDERTIWTHSQLYYVFAPTWNIRSLQDNHAHNNRYIFSIEYLCSHTHIWIIEYLFKYIFIIYINIYKCV